LAGCAGTAAGIANTRASAAANCGRHLKSAM
jgi:hypothetical protein